MAKHEYEIDFATTFNLRAPALVAMRINHTLNGTTLEIDRPLETYSPSQQAVIEFARTPTSPIKLTGLDLGVAQAIVAALVAVYTNGTGSWD